jgi:ribosome-associated toxin RatA of RatAB toxin-antitoxin module
MLRRCLVQLLELCIATSLLCMGADARGADKTTSKATRYSVKTSFSNIEAGAARIEVGASPDRVIGIVCDYSNYSRLTDRFDKSRIIGRSGPNTDVYLQVPILKGLARIWAVVRFEPVHNVKGEQIVVGHLVKGNVERLDATWRTRSTAEHRSHLELELLIVPKFPVPASVVTGEVAFAADRAVTGVRDRAERE